MVRLLANNMKSSDLDELENKVNQLIELNKALQDSNNQLLDNEASLIAERDRLKHKNQIARQKISSMIERLKSLEQGHGQQ